MRTFKLILAYDGTNYAGWQVQVNQPTVQGVLEAALQEITGEKIRTIASGRTDSGVHALGQVVSFCSSTNLAADVITRALTASLPVDVIVQSTAEVATGFHATHDAVRKHYRYHIAEGPHRHPFERGHAWLYPKTLDDVAMAKAAKSLVGTHDFASFATNGSKRESTVRTIFRLEVRRGPAVLHLERSHAESRNHLIIDVEADGFLYNMVRNIVGALVVVGRGLESPSWMAEVLQKRCRRACPAPAPPQGLFLMRVDYKNDHAASPDA